MLMYVLKFNILWEICVYLHKLLFNSLTLQIILGLSKAYSGDLCWGCFCNGTESAVMTRLEMSCEVAVAHSQWTDSVPTSPGLLMATCPWLLVSPYHPWWGKYFREHVSCMSKTTSFTKYVPFEPGSPAAALQDMTFQSWEQSALCSHPSWDVCVGKHWLSSLHRALKQTHSWYWAFCPWCPMSNS